MNINLTEYGDCIVVKGTYKETGHMAVLLTDLENRVIAQISKDLPNANLSAQLLALPEFTKTIRRTKSSYIFDSNTYYIWKFTGA